MQRDKDGDGELLSSDYGPGRRQMAIVFSLIPAIGIAWSIADLIRGNHSSTVVTSLVVWAIVGMMLLAASRAPVQVSLNADSLRIRNGRHLRDISLSQVRSVELDFPKRGRTILLLVEREDGDDPTLESIEFIPRDVGLGFDGRGGSRLPAQTRRRGAGIARGEATRSLEHQRLNRMR